MMTHARMKTLGGALLGVLALAASASATASPFVPEEGIYQGEFTMDPETEGECSTYPPSPASVEVVLTSPSTVELISFLILPDGTRLDYDVTSCLLQGVSMHCDASDQVLDLSFLGLDAIVTNHADHGMGVWKNPTEHSIHSSGRFQTCVGEDCEEAATFFGPGFGFPCKFSPSTILRVKVAE
ncbi:MAG: hypothetical protein H6729_01160 [Deltaproteobacteria bacterium]|nr:hypothetical protein [Deltaproteobacteria bacterium]